MNIIVDGGATANAVKAKLLADRVNDLERLLMDELGKIAYEAYCKARNWRSVRGEPLPHFEQQEPELQEAWDAAAEAVAKHLRSATGRGY